MTESRTTLTLWLLLASTLTAPRLAALEQEGSLQGRVVDSRTQLPVPGALVSLLLEGAVHESTTAGKGGEYRFDGRPEGLYQILVERPSYQPALQHEARVVRGKTSVYDFELVQLRISESVVVTPKARADDPRTPVTSFSYDREQLRRSPGTGGDVLRALDSLPGVAATGDFASFTVRGRGPRDNLILVDGIPFDKVIHFDETIGEQEDPGGGHFSIFAPNLIGEAEFQPGGFSAAYGGKNASLLRLEIAEGNRVSPTASARVDIAGWEATYDGPTYVLGSTSLLLSARNLQFERVFKLVGEESLGAPSLTDVIAKTTSQMGTRHRLDLLAIHAPEAFERNVEDVLAQDPIEDVFLANNRQDNTLFGARWRWVTSDSSVLSNTFYHRESDSRSRLGESFPDLAPKDALPEDVPVREDILDLREGEREVGWRGDFSHVTRGGGGLRMGARFTHVRLDYSTILDGDWIRYVYDQSDYRPDPDQKFILLQPEFVNSKLDASAYRAAGYGEYSFRVGPFTLTPGIRYDYEGFAGQSLWSPRLNANVSLGGKTRLNLATGVFYQFPRYLDLAADPANGDLRSERSLQFLAGLNRFLGDDLRLSVEAYYQRLDNLVVRPDRTTGRATSGGEGYARGVDVLIAKSLRDRFYWQVNYSYSISNRDDNFGEGRFETDFNRPHLFGLSFGYELSDSWVIGAKWRYASGRPTGDFIVHEDVLGDSDPLRFSKEITRKNALRLRDFQTLNLRVDYRRRMGPTTLVLFVDFLNVYNYKNVSALEWNERTGRNIEDGLEAFPIFGLKFEF